MHAVHLDKSLEEARYLGAKLGLAAREGRQPVDDEALWSEYGKEVWHIYPEYMYNLTNDTYDYNQSLPEQAIRHSVLKNREAVSLMQEAADGIKEVTRLHKLGNREEAQRRMVTASMAWIRSTWAEYLADDVIGAEIPDTYRNVDED